MRAPAMIAFIIVAGILTAWLYFRRVPEPVVTAPATATIAARAPVADVQDSAPSTRPVTSAPASASASTSAPAATTSAANPAQVGRSEKRADATPTVSTDATATTAATANPGDAAAAIESKTADETTAQPNPDSAGAAIDATPADATTDAGADTSAGDDTGEVSTDEPAPDDHAGTSPIDSNRAADLIADWLARQDSASGEGVESAPNMRLSRTLDDETTDADWSAAMAQKIEAALHQRLDALSGDMRDHVDLMRVECRQTICQILGAETIVTSADGHPLSGAQWPTLVDTLSQQPLWREGNFVEMSTVTNRDDASGYVLYQTYLRRAVSSPE